jgi:hypothetical protein
MRLGTSTKFWSQFCYHTFKGVFEQDNATPHIARVTQRLFNDNNVNLLPWPASSPDLSPIEHVWHMIGRRVEDFPAPIGTLAELRVQIQRAWDEIPQSYSCARRYHHALLIFHDTILLTCYNSSLSSIDICVISATAVIY